MAAVLQNTSCDPRFVESLGQIGARLGDRTAARRAADQALAALALKGSGSTAASSRPRH